jgi:hypothetical protein
VGGAGELGSWGAGSWGAGSSFGCYNWLDLVVRSKPIIYDILVVKEKLVLRSPFSVLVSMVGIELKSFIFTISSRPAGRAPFAHPRWRLVPCEGGWDVFSRSGDRRGWCVASRIPRSKQTDQRRLLFFQHSLHGWPPNVHAGKPDSSDRKYAFAARNGRIKHSASPHHNGLTRNSNARMSK